MGRRGVLFLLLSIFLILSFGFVIADHEKDHIGGVDDKTYSNSCFAGLGNVEVACGGECPCETESPPEESPEEPPNATATVTGSIISVDNEFFNYRYG